MMTDIMHDPVFCPMGQAVISLYELAGVATGIGCMLANVPVELPRSLGQQSMLAC